MRSSSVPLRLVAAAVAVIVVVVGLAARPSSAQCFLDVLMVLDHSGSINDNDEGPIPNWIAITDAISEVVRVTACFPDIRYAAIGFGSDARLEFNFDRYTETVELVVAFRSIENRGGNSNATGALRLSRTDVWPSLANRPLARDLLVLVTDGVPSRRYEADGLADEVAAVKALGVRVVGIGVTTAVDADAIRRLVSTPASENYFGLANFTQLAGVIEELCDAPEPSPETTTTTTTTTTMTTTTTTSATTPSSPTSTTSTTSGSTTSSMSTPTSPTSTTSRSFGYFTPQKKFLLL